MSYPKPLQEKTLERRWAQTGLPGETIQFIRDFVEAAAELYGYIEAQALWNIYRSLVETEDVPYFHKKDLFAAMGLLRREEHNYFVFEVDELFDLERDDKKRFVVNKKLVRKGYDKFELFYSLYENTRNVDYFVPYDFLMVPSVMTDAEEALLLFLSRLKSVEGPCKGKRLAQFTYHEGVGLHPTEDEGTAAEYVFDNYVFDCTLGFWSPIEEIQEMVDLLEQVGIRLSKQQFEKLVSLLMDVNNRHCSWFLRGNSPMQVSRSQTPGQQPTISFGPGIKKAVAEGTLDKEELEAGLAKMGIQWTW